MVSLKDAYFFMGLGAVLFAVSGILSTLIRYSGGSNACVSSFSYIGLLFIIIGIYVIGKKRDRLPEELKKGANLAFYGVVALCIVLLISIGTALSIAEDAISLGRSNPDVTIKNVISLIRNYLPALIFISVASGITYVLAVGGTNFWNKDFSLKLLIFFGIILIIISLIVEIPYIYEALDNIEQKHGNTRLEDADFDVFQEYTITNTGYLASVLNILGYLAVGIPNFITGNRLPEEKSEIEKEIDSDYSTRNYKLGSQRPYTGAPPLYPNQMSTFYGQPQPLSRFKIGGNQIAAPGVNKKECRFCGRHINWRAIYCPWCKKYLL